MSEYVELLLSDFRTDHPGVVEEWERQREDALEQGEPIEDWPDHRTATGLLWWLRSEDDLSEELSRKDDTGRETAIGHYCVAAIEDLQRAIDMNTQVEGERGR